MKYVPSNPPPVNLPDDYWQLRSPSSVRPVKPVQPRSAPALATSQDRTADATSPEEAPEISSQERRQSPSNTTERRTVCRRVLNRPVLIELRSSVNRRRNRQRETDRLESISQQV